ncbi:MAG TPA: PilZ domain-containing protein [Candidatus Acidoferrum sp.]|jgi:hypothetical protein|nr:PilZ domain-containing protein [Candidatus Acidoferrum sp.]
METPIKNRRSAPRARVSLPVRVRCFGSNWPEELGKTTNVSREGIYFETKSRHYLEQYFHNWKVRVIRNFQTDDLTNLEETGQIVRIDHLPEGKLGVAIHILLREKPEFIEGPKSINSKK